MKDALFEKEYPNGPGALALPALDARIVKAAAAGMLRENHPLSRDERLRLVARLQHQASILKTVATWLSTGLGHTYRATPCEHSQLVDPDLSLREVRGSLVADLQAGGGHCPVCQQRTKIYKRKLNASMAYALVLIHKRFKYREDWLHVPSFLNGFGETARGGDWAKLVWWGLLTEKPDTREDGAPHVGYWKITERGVAFASGAITVSKYVYFYNGEARAYGAEQTNVRDALGDKFHYGELMAS